MSANEQSGTNKIAMATVAVVAVLAAAVFVWRYLGDGSPPSATRAYFSDDDGKTLFVDDINKVTPFEHNGKQANYAGVYQCGPNGKPFVVFLRRWNDKARAAVEPLLAKTGDQKVDKQIADIREGAIEVKKPGDIKWVSEASSAGATVMTPVCPGGGTDTRVVFP